MGRMHDPCWSYPSLRGKVEITSYLGTKVIKAQVQKGFSRPPRRAAQQCRGPRILNIPHSAPLQSATCTPAMLHLVPILGGVCPGLAFISFWSCYGGIGHGQNKRADVGHGKCSQTQSESRMCPPLSECPGSVPLISSPWARLREWQSHQRLFCAVLMTKVSAQLWVKGMCLISSVVKSYGLAPVESKVWAQN